MTQPLQIALAGNPNSGKSSLFNELTGLNQKVGNFPGVTVDKKTGVAAISPTLSANIIDLPGTYSLYPRRADEWVSYKVLLQQDASVRPDMMVLVADASNLRRSLLFCTQIIDLKYPVIIALTMMDIARSKGVKVDIPGLERELGVPVVPVNPRKNKGVDQLKRMIEQTATALPVKGPREFIYSHMLAPVAIDEVRLLFPKLSHYQALHYLINHENFDLPSTNKEKIETIRRHNRFNATKTQAEEIMQRYERIRHVMQQTVVEADPLQKTLFTEKLDNILLHRRWGYLILLTVLFFLFQAVFWIAKYPMNAIEWSFGLLQNNLQQALPSGLLNDFLVNGILAGLSGILVFVPQIMILFGIINILEDTGYMARISFLTDKIMRKAGLNGKSVMPMISGFACAVPAIMSARSIENRKERLLTILITPLMSCSARLPVYTILIAMVIPAKTYFGFISLQGIVMMLSYLLGTLMAMLVATVMKWFIRSAEKSYFILELPVYRSPRWKNIFHTMFEKARIFVWDAGKVIMVISLSLWALSSFGPAGSMKLVEDKYAEQLRQQPQDSVRLIREKNAARLQSSYAGILGRKIEPVISPLGFDWKIGIALITSFAAREVFVGTMVTLYSVGDGADEKSLSLKEKMQSARREDGTPVYTLAAGLSLLIFYILAMQCMSTLAIVKRETRSWKWPMIQLAYMTGLAYLCSLIVYQVLR